MSASNSLEPNKEENWFTRTFSSKQSASQGSNFTSNGFTSITNPSFESFGDILRSKRTIENPPRNVQNSIDQSIVDIAVNAHSDTSSLADRSKGTTDFFRPSKVSCIFISHSNNIYIGQAFQ